MTDIPAKAVCVVKIWRASCLLPGCDWEGEDSGSYQEANQDRLAHLEEHRSA